MADGSKANRCSMREEKRNYLVFFSIHANHRALLFLSRGFYVAVPKQDIGDYV